MAGGNWDPSEGAANAVGSSHPVVGNVRPHVAQLAIGRGRLKSHLASAHALANAPEFQELAKGMDLMGTHARALMAMHQRLHGMVGSSSLASVLITPGLVGGRSAPAPPPLPPEMPPPAPA